MLRLHSSCDEDADGAVPAGAGRRQTLADAVRAAFGRQRLPADSGRQYGPRDPFWMQDLKINCMLFSMFLENNQGRMMVQDLNRPGAERRSRLRGRGVRSSS